MVDNSGWDPSSQPTNPTGGDPTQIATDVYHQLSALAGGSALPLVLLGLPSHTGTQVNLIAAPGAGTTVKSYYGATLDATFPGDDLYIELHADMEWHLPLTAATQTSDNSLITFSDPGHSHSITDVTHTHTITDSGHQHTVTDSGHQHTLSGVTAPAPVGQDHNVGSSTHIHKTFGPVSSVFVDNPTNEFVSDVLGNELNVASGSHGSGFWSWAYDSGVFGYNVRVSDYLHTHSFSATDKVASGTASVTTPSPQSTGVTNASTLSGLIGTQPISAGLAASPHKHIISPTTASIRATMALVIDGTIVTSGLINGNLFQAGGFTGTDGIIHMANVFILKKDSSTVNLLRGGHHKVGLYFSITVVDWSSGVASFNNPSFSIRNAGNDDRVQTYTP